MQLNLWLTDCGKAADILYENKIKSVKCQRWQICPGCVIISVTEIKTQRTETCSPVGSPGIFTYTYKMNISNPPPWSSILCEIFVIKGGICHGQTETDGFHNGSFNGVF